MAFINAGDRRQHKIASKPWVFRKLLPWQSKVFKSNKRFRIVVAGRRCGKTALATMMIHMTALAAKKPINIAVIYPLKNQAKQLIWKDLLDDYNAHPLYFSKADQSNLYLQYKNGSRVYIYSLENAKQIRGQKFRLVVLDEFQDATSLDDFHKIILPTVTTTIDDEKEGIEPGRIIVFGTSKGQNALYKLIEDNKNNPEWQTFIFPTNSINASHISVSELESLKASIPIADWEREYECSFESYKGLIYGEFKDQYNLRQLPNITPTKVVMGIDFGYSPHPLAIVVCALYGSTWYVIDEYKKTNMAIQDVANVANAMIKKHNVTIIYASPEENANQNELRKLVNIQVASAENSVNNGIAYVRSLIHSDPIQNINPKLYLAEINGKPICEELIKEIKSYTYKDNVEEPVKTNDDLVDAMRYAIYTYHKKSTGGAKLASGRAY